MASDSGGTCGRTVVVEASIWNKDLHYWWRVLNKWSHNQDSNVIVELEF
jgi:hypothetical protein